MKTKNSEIRRIKNSISLQERILANLKDSTYQFAEAIQLSEKILSTLRAQLGLLEAK